MPHRTNSRSFATTYAFDEKARVFVPVAAHDDLAYSDGDTTEDGLLALMRRASDRSLHSPELAAGAVDWPTRYHLSPARANLLRPLAHLLRGHTLEVGSGCGALTRYLGELGGRLVALEGSRRRAAITAARCRGLDNVAVYNERLERFATDLRFSAITLVGVLEWASRFVDGVDGPRKVLEQAARLLDDDGVLVIAIENQLGLKYFAGWPEDHLGVAMSGINDTYRAGEPRTFGLRDLTARVAGAGFVHQAVYAPFPDYKFPRFVVSPSGLDDRAWTADMATIAAATPVTDPQGPALPLFSLEQTLALVARNGLLRDLSNSFLLVASRQAATVHDDPALLGWHYSGDRRPQYLRETRFRRSAHGITLEHRLLAPPAALPPLVDDAIRHREATSAFLAGEVWITRLGPILNRPAWTIADVVAWATPWRDALVREAGLQDATAIARVPSHLMDAAPFNLVHANGQFRFFDLEWEPPWGVEYGYALFRGLFWSLARFHSVAEPAEGVPLGLATLSSALAAALGAPITPSDEHRYLDIEAELQHQVGSVATVKAREDLSARRLRARSSLESLAGITGQIESLKEVNRQIEVGRDELRDELQRHQAALRHSIERSEAEREDLQRQLTEATHALEQLETARQATKAQLDASETARRLTTAELATAQAETDRARHQLTEVREGLEAARREIEAQLDASETARRLMTAELEAATAELATAQAETDRARRQLTETREELEAARRATEARLDASETARRLATAQLEAAIAELATAKAQTDLARGELAKTHEEVQGFSERIQAAERLAHEQSRRIRAGQRALRLTRMEAEERGRQVRQAAALAVSGDDPGAVRASIVTRAVQRFRQAQLSPRWSLRHPWAFVRSVARLTSRSYRAQVALVADSRLFDAAHYRAITTLPPGADVLAHFLCVGDVANQSPHPLFDAVWYRQRNPDVPASDGALMHYLRYGGWELRDPHPLFDTRHYLAQWPADTVHAATPLSHFLRVGFLGAASPHPLFDIGYYWQQRPDVLASGENPLVHYLRHALAEDIDPHPLFDTSFYLEQAPDLRERAINPLAHFLQDGWRDGLKPNPWFDPAWYLDRNRDLPGDSNPLFHYLQHGWREDRDPSPAFSISSYFAQNPAVRGCGMEPLTHFLRYGRAEGPTRM